VQEGGGGFLRGGARFLHVSTGYPQLWHRTSVETAIFWVGGLLTLSAVALIVSALVQAYTAHRIRPNAELQADLAAMYTQLADLSDFVQRKDTRERVRRLRDNREAAKDGPPAPQPGTPEFKAHLRRIALQKGTVQ